MAKRESNPTIGTILGGALAVVVALWLLLKVFRTVLWFVKVGVVIAVIAVIVYAVRNATKKK
jgi:hypothetical protein